MTDTSKYFTVEFGPPEARRRERVRLSVSVDGTEKCWIMRHPTEDREVVLARGPYEEDQAEMGRRAREEVGRLQRVWQGESLAAH